MTISTPDRTTTSPDYAAIKTKQKAAWGSGNYAKVGVTLQITGEELCESMDLRSGQTVLDVAGGNGNVTLAAAHRFCKVTSTDYVQTLLDQSRQRCTAEGLNVSYQLADAEDLPFSSNSFDNVVSTFGVMFTPNQSRAASELMRVCKPGGKIGMSSWTPDGFIGQLFKTLGGYLPPPAGVHSPARWGTDEFLNDQFATEATNISGKLKHFNFRYESIDHWLEVFGTFYGPVLKAFESLDAENSALLKRDIRGLLNSLNEANDGTLVVPGAYLETVITM